MGIGNLNCCIFSASASHWTSALFFILEDRFLSVFILHHRNCHSTVKGIVQSFTHVHRLTGCLLVRTSYSWERTADNPSLVCVFVPGWYQCPHHGAGITLCMCDQFLKIRVQFLEKKGWFVNWIHTKNGVSIYTFTFRKFWRTSH